MNKEKFTLLAITFVFFYLLGGGMCRVFFPATVTPFLELTCPEGTTPASEQIRRFFGNGISLSSRASCEGAVETEWSRTMGVIGARILHQSTVALVLMGIGWLWLRYQGGKSEPPPAPPPGINLEGDMVLRQFISQKQRLDAVKHVREMTGAGLKEAKAYVDWLSYQMQGGGRQPGSVETPRPMMSLDAAAHDFQVLDFLTQGQKIMAIKRVRELTGIGLKEAKDLVEAIERGQIEINRPLTPLPPTNPTFPMTPEQATNDPEVHELLARGLKINAIKRVRELTGVGLKEAKDLVDGLERG